MPGEREVIEELERRVAQLEAAVRALLAGRMPERAKPPEVARPWQQGAPPSRVEAPAPRPGWRPRLPPDFEQVIGQRVLLAAGVLALLAAAGLFLKLAFERGWISPTIRVVGAVAAGIGTAVLGEALIRRGLRRYGAALVGAGGGLAYLGFWAAGAAYSLLAAQVSLFCLLATAVAVAYRAIARRAEGLAIWALVGAYLAPVVLPRGTAGPEAFLTYVAVVGLAAGYVARRLGWRVALGLSVLGYFLLPGVLAMDAVRSWVGVGYVAAGGIAGLLVTARGWPEVRLASFLLPWWILFAGAPDAEPMRWTALGVAFALTAISWAHGRATNPLARGRDRPVADPVEALVFALSPLLLVAWTALRGPGALEDWGGLVPFLAACAYAGVGWRRRLSHMVGMGFVLLALAVSGQWDGVAVATGWALLAVAGIVAEVEFGRRVGRAMGLFLALFAFLQLFSVSLARRSTEDPAFTGAWAAGLYALAILLAVAAWRWRTHKDDPEWLRSGSGHLWILHGAALFVGGSIELRRLFDSTIERSPAAAMTSNLVLSAYWLVYAALVVGLGFRLGKKPVRVAGLGVAGLALGKVALYDLANLEALYRVGSLFALAVIALGIAYAYHSAQRSRPL